MTTSKIKFLLLHFPNLCNYGTGMMGLVTIQALVDRFGADKIEIYCDVTNQSAFDDIRRELHCDPNLHQYINEKLQKLNAIKNSPLRKLKRFFYFADKEFDSIIVLGGDDLSEYYAPHAAFSEIFEKWKISFHTNVILLGQTIGPFASSLNRFACRFMMPRFTVYARDPWCVEYFQQEFNQKINQTADLALSALPLQHNKSIEKEILTTYDLLPSQYITIVISGMIQS
jgi:colanic acid/amylovoran biosynthesis protein